MIHINFSKFREFEFGEDHTNKNCLFLRVYFVFGSKNGQASNVPVEYGLRIPIEQAEVCYHWIHAFVHFNQTKCKNL